MKTRLEDYLAPNSPVVTCEKQTLPHQQRHTRARKWKEVQARANGQESREAGLRASERSEGNVYMALLTGDRGADKRGEGLS